MAGLHASKVVQLEIGAFPCYCHSIVVGLGRCKERSKIGKPLVQIRGEKRIFPTKVSWEKHMLWEPVLFSRGTTWPSLMEHLAQRVQPLQLSKWLTG